VPPSVTEQYERTASAYLDATDRPLSPGELFALAILVVTFIGCLAIALFVGLSQPTMGIQPEFARELGLSRTVPDKARWSPITDRASPQAPEEPVRLDYPPQ
jgi:hypothetical protein